MSKRIIDVPDGEYCVGCPLEGKNSFVCALYPGQGLKSVGAKQIKHDACVQAIKDHNER